MSAERRAGRRADDHGYMGSSAPTLIVAGRYVPGLRFVVNPTMGVSKYPYRRFLHRIGHHLRPNHHGRDRDPVSRQAPCGPRPAADGIVLAAIGRSYWSSRINQSRVAQAIPSLIGLCAPRDPLGR